VRQPLLVGAHGRLPRSRERVGPQNHASFQRDIEARDARLFDARSRVFQGGMAERFNALGLHTNMDMDD